MLELQPTFLHNREKSKANVREGSERDSELKSGNAEAFQSISQSNQRLKALKINSKFFFFGSLFLFSCPKKEKVNKEQTISKVLSNKLKRKVRGGCATRKAAFTLAEVLITLGIIGIVAAMTMPMLIANYRKKEIPIRLKKFSATIQNAFNMATVDYGPTSNWNFPVETGNADQNDEFLNTYLFPYLKGIRACNKNECTKIGDNMGHSGPVAAYIFTDGSCFTFVTGGSSASHSSMHLYYDYNCLGKPNKRDQDQFAFIMSANTGKEITFKAGGIKTINLTKREDLLEACKNHEIDGHSPGTCSALIEFDGWEIKDDYPWL